MTSSVLDVGLWTNLLIAKHKTAGREGGPAIINWEEKITKSAKLDVVINSYLINLCSEVKEFLVDVKSFEDVTEQLSAFRSLRRASDTRALSVKVCPNDIGMVNLWKKVENTKGKVTTGLMRKLHAKFSSLEKPFLRYTRAT